MLRYRHTPFHPDIDSWILIKQLEMYIHIKMHDLEIKTLRKRKKKNVDKKCRMKTSQSR